MSLDQQAIVKQIDAILEKYNADNAALRSKESLTTTANMLSSAIQRLAPPGSIYARNVPLYDSRLENAASLSLAIQSLRGMLRALRNDYESGYLQSVVELVHADIFSDFLDMADYLIQQGYKDPAAVVAGSVLEEHLRKLCGKHGVTVVKNDGTPKTADALNSELGAAGAYSKLDQKSVTAWQDLRNKAAHGEYGKYTQEQVTLMILGVRDFASRYPA